MLGFSRLLLGCRHSRIGTPVTWMDKDTGERVTTALCQDCWRRVPYTPPPAREFRSAQPKVMKVGSA